VLAEQGAPVLFVEGRLGHRAKAELEKAVSGMPQAGAIVTIDLSGVDYISSAALRVLAVFAERQSAHGGRLVLRAPSVVTRISLELSGLMALVEPRP
jgi:anti-anti-sigma factor